MGGGYIFPSISHQWVFQHGQLGHLSIILNEWLIDPSVLDWTCLVFVWRAVASMSLSPIVIYVIRSLFSPLNIINQST